MQEERPEIPLRLPPGMLLCPIDKVSCTDGFSENPRSEGGRRGITMRVGRIPTCVLARRAGTARGDVSHRRDYRRDQDAPLKCPVLRKRQTVAFNHRSVCCDQLRIVVGPTGRLSLLTFFTHTALSRARKVDPELLSRFKTSSGNVTFVDLRARTSSALPMHISMLKNMYIIVHENHG